MLKLKHLDAALRHEARMESAAWRAANGDSCGHSEAESPARKTRSKGKPKSRAKKPLLERLKADIRAAEKAGLVESADNLREAIREIEHLTIRLNSWLTRGRDLMLHDPEMSPSMEALKERIRLDPEFAMSLLPKDVKRRARAAARRRAETTEPL